MKLGGLMNINKKRLLTYVFALVIGPVGLIMLYQGCGLEPASNVSSTAICNANSSSAPIDKNYDVIPGQQTVSIVYGRQMLDSMVTCLGLGQPSATAEAEWTSRNQTLSEYGNATDVSGAMMMAITAVAGEVCNDLVNKETTQVPADRGFFGSSNLASNVSLSASEIESAADMLAYSCWQRGATAEEKGYFINSIGAMNTNARLGALSICTAVLSSLSGIMQ